MNYTLKKHKETAKDNNPKVTQIQLISTFKLNF